MRLRLITEPEPAVTLPEAKAHLRVTHSLDEDSITSLVAAASQRAEQEAGRAFGEQTWEAVLSEFPTGNIELCYGPLVSVTSIIYIDSDDVEQTVDEDTYEFEEAAKDGVIIPLSGWPTAKATSNAVVVRFVAGDGWPTDIKQAVLMMVAHWYSNREAVVVGQSAAEIPYGATALIGLRRRMFV